MSPYTTNHQAPEHRGTDRGRLKEEYLRYDQRFKSLVTKVGGNQSGLVQAMFTSHKYLKEKRDQYGSII